MADAKVLSNQKTILANQARIVKNQKAILSNQKTIVKNQTNVSIIMCVILFTLIQIGKIAHVDFLSLIDLFSDGISTIIAFNYFFC